VNQESSGKVGQGKRIRGKRTGTRCEPSVAAIQTVTEGARQSQQTGRVVLSGNLQEHNHNHEVKAKEHVAATVACSNESVGPLRNCAHQAERADLSGKGRGVEKPSRHYREEKLDLLLPKL